MLLRFWRLRRPAEPSGPPGFTPQAAILLPLSRSVRPTASFQFMKERQVVLECLVGGVIVPITHPKLKPNAMATSRANSQA